MKGLHRNLALALTGLLLAGAATAAPRGRAPKPSVEANDRGPFTPDYTPISVQPIPPAPPGPGTPSVAEEARKLGRARHKGGWNPVVVWVEIGDVDPQNDHTFTLEYKVIQGGLALGSVIRRSDSATEVTVKAGARYGRALLYTRGVFRAQTLRITAKDPKTTSSADGELDVLPDHPR